MEEILLPPERDPKVLELLEREATSDAYDAALALSDMLFNRHGVRPSVGNVRAILKRGSNTTIQKAVDTFWLRLKERNRLAIPSMPVPESVADSFGQIWRSALIEAERLFEVERAKCAEQVRVAQEAQAAADLRADSYWDMAEQARASETAALDRAKASEKLAESAQEARARAEREADDARLAADAARDESRAAQDRAEQAIQESDNRARQAIAKIEAQYEGLRHHLLEETARERDHLKQQHDQAMSAMELERETFRAQRHRLEMGQADLRDQLSQCKREAANSQATIGSLEREAERREQEITRLNSQVERLMRMLEGIASRATPGESNDSSDTALDAMQDVMRAVHADLADDQGVATLSDWRLEAIERYQDSEGLDANAGSLFDAALSVIDLQWKK